MKDFWKTGIWNLHKREFGNSISAAETIQIEEKDKNGAAAAGQALR